jgi:hypothetical protein
MANYYLRTKTCTFIGSETYTDDRFLGLFYEIYSGQTLVYSETLTALGSINPLNQSVFTIIPDELTVPNKLILRRDITNVSQYDIGVSNYKFYFFYLSNLSSFAESVWASKNWTTSNITTFKNELCWYIELAKLQPSNWGQDDGTNLILMKIYHPSNAGVLHYYPFFYKGNDPRADEVIVV